MRVIARLLAVLLLTAAPLSAQAPAPPPPDLIGEWTLTTVSPIGENSNTVEFRREDDALKAYAKAPTGPGERPYDRTALDGRELTLVLTIDFQGAPMVITYVGTVSDTSINGSADFGGMAMGSFSAVRKGATP